MSGDCDICGSYEHVEYSCPHRWNNHIERIEEPEEWAQEAAKQIFAYLKSAKHPSYYDIARIIIGENDQHKDKTGDNICPDCNTTSNMLRCEHCGCQWTP